MSTETTFRHVRVAPYPKLMIVAAAAIGLAATPAQAGVSWAALQTSPSTSGDKQPDVRPAKSIGQGFVVASRTPN